jgi:hypothetical protein
MDNEQQRERLKFLHQLLGGLIFIFILFSASHYMSLGHLGTAVLVLIIAAQLLYLIPIALSNFLFKKNYTKVAFGITYFAFIMFFVIDIGIFGVSIVS